MTRLPSPLLRWLEPLSSGLWIGFLLWSAVAALVWAFGVGETEVAARLQRYFPQPGAGAVGFQTPLAGAMSTILALLDPVWVALAAVNAYSSVAVSEGLGRARLWSLWIFTTALAIGGASVLTGWPMGPVHFTGRLGPQLFLVPLGVPLLWGVMIFGSRQALRRLWPHAGHAQVALGTGVLAVLTAWNLEPVAWHQRVWWLWDAGGAPWRLYATWLLAAAGLAWACRSGGNGARREGWQAACAFAILNALAGLARLAQAFRS